VALVELAALVMLIRVIGERLVAVAVKIPAETAYHDELGDSSADSGEKASLMSRIFQCHPHDIEHGFGGDHDTSGGPLDREHQHHRFFHRSAVPGPAEKV
jgi:hypothetical protein